MPFAPVFTLVPVLWLVILPAYHLVETAEGAFSEILSFVLGPVGLILTIAMLGGISPALKLLSNSTAIINGIPRLTTRAAWTYLTLTAISPIWLAGVMLSGSSEAVTEVLLFSAIVGGVIGYGFATVATLCPHCHHAFNSHYRGYEEASFKCSELGCCCSFTCVASPCS